MLPSRAEAGSIDVRADSITGNGTLDAPGDASVTITNQTPAFIVIEDIIIPENTGGVFLNGDVYGAASTSPAPSIVVENTLDVTQASVTEGGTVTYAWPGIKVLGEIANASGSLTLKAYSLGAGSITIDGTVNVLDQYIFAGTSGSVVINVPGNGTSYPVAGSAYSRLSTLTKQWDSSDNGCRRDEFHYTGPKQSGGQPEGFANLHQCRIC